ncbi:MAG TPA: dUTP diphosphatase [Vicinamibacterales bacterium]|nr:dUTP diphosphatase [Vicinamibacterales bacterium]
MWRKAERPLSDPLTVRITRIHPDATLPEYQTGDAAGFDLASVATVTVEPGRVALVPTGLVIKVPLRMFLGIFARSSTPVKRGLMIANGVGVIDPDYCGATDEVKIAVMNFTGEPVTVRPGDRIAQGILLEAARVEWVEAEADERSRGGFGSSG